MSSPTKTCKDCGHKIVRYGSGNYWQSVGQTYDRCRVAHDGKHEPVKVGSLSPVQQDAVDTARVSGGRLVRWPGGFWTYPGVALAEGGSSDRVPTWHVSTNTIKGLLRRGAVVEVDWRETEGFNGPSRYCVVVALPDADKEGTM
jgi:hypothetical protein